jgi:hypothetical protein
MPQFDFYSFFNQIFWFALFSPIFYLLFLKNLISKSGESIKAKEKLLLLLNSDSVKTLEAARTVRSNFLKKK